YATAQARVLQIQLGNTVDNDAEVCKQVWPTAAIGDGPGAGSGTGSPERPMPVPAQPSTSDPGASMKLAGLIGGGVGLVTLGLGVYFGVQAKTINDDIEDQGPDEKWRDDIEAYMDKGQRYEYMQIGFLAVGGALVIGGAVVYVMGRGKTSAATEQQTQVSITPSVSPGGGGVTLFGRF
ncbi:MAG: hypothetical protein H0T42_19375, partial [Deltaproteobacteria bacterium]|nr:hypothetical protein [Deltaproteobacteria bacterium]